MLRRTIITIALLCVGAAGLAASPAAAAPTSTAECISRGTILTFKPWYANTVEFKAGSGGRPGTCEIKSPGDTADKQRDFIWGIVLVIVEDIFQLAAYIAVGFIMYGGFLYLTSTGSPENTKRAMSTIVNAVIGMVVAISAAAIVGFIGGSL